MAYSLPSLPYGFDALEPLSAPRAAVPDGNT